MTTKPAGLVEDAGAAIGAAARAVDRATTAFVEGRAKDVQMAPAVEGQAALAKMTPRELEAYGRKRVEERLQEMRDAVEPLPKPDKRPIEMTSDEFKKYESAWKANMIAKNG